MQTFYRKQNEWKQQLCRVCFEVWPTRSHVNNESTESFICTCCKRDKKTIKKFSEENNMHPGRQPPCLSSLSQVEEMFIARACPIMQVYTKHGGQHGYQLPRSPSSLLVIVVRKAGADNTHIDLTVR